jgi:thiamine kinase-like enzyme
MSTGEHTTFPNAQSFREGRQWLSIVAAAHAAQASTWAEGDVTVERMTGGNNNALYRVEMDGRSYACKLCVPDWRQRAACEYASLRLFHTSGLDIAPEPLWLDESCQIVPYPALAYRWLRGESLDTQLTQTQLAAVLASVQLMHTLTPNEHPRIRDSWFHWFDWQRYLAELGDFLDQYGAWLEATISEGRDLRERLARLIDCCAQCVAAARVSPSRDRIALRICRADTNLANAIWSDDGRVRWVDWEYSGWGDPALELAEMRWHVAMSSMTEEQHNWLRDNYGCPAGDDGFEERLAVWDRLITTRWAFLILRALWSAYNGPDRLRLSRIAADPDQLHIRFIQFIERAEHIVG